MRAPRLSARPGYPRVPVIPVPVIRAPRLSARPGYPRAPVIRAPRIRAPGYASAPVIRAPRLSEQISNPLELVSNQTYKIPALTDLLSSEFRQSGSTVICNFIFTFYGRLQNGWLQNNPPCALYKLDIINELNFNPEAKRSTSKEFT